MSRNFHEIRDPIHAFVQMDNDEREVVNSRPFQRLRHVHQLALTYLIYPAATHKRFEHSLGVMELASRVYDVVTHPDNVTEKMKDRLRPLTDSDKLRYWRRTLRMAALCHDIGHLPFSHAAEKELLPEEWDHERLTRELIASEEMQEIWNRITPPLRVEDVVKLAVGPKKAKHLTFNDWETILSEIIVGDAFGVDRMDYLLRDSHHIGVAYGKFDHYRLIDTLRILPMPSCGDDNESSEELALGVEEGGIHSAEALLLARYFMYSQVYCHPVRRIYDIHLTDFLREWLPDARFPTDLQQHLRMTDNEVTAALLDAAHDQKKRGHVHARRIVARDHFKLIYQRNPSDVEINPEAGKAIFEALCDKFGSENFRHDRYHQKSGSSDFPVKMRDGRIVSSLAISQALNTIPVVSVDYVFAERAVFNEAEKYLRQHRDKIIRPKKEEDNG
ncbi:MAG: HD domain-containing protein [Thermogutta sp.]|nr:HD domain-containing protein [Thermogutta sp.]HPU06926.1 HD domain-containing protein [Thermogutta sp.]